MTNAPNSTPRIRGLAQNLIFNALLPLIAVNVLQARGMKLIPALALASIFPAFEVCLTWWRVRRLDALGAIVLALIAVGAAASLVTGDVHFALARTSFGTAIFGLLCLGSFLMPRPLLFFFGRSFAAGSDPERLRAWDARWGEEAIFRSVLRIMTAVWGIAFLLEAALRIVLVYVLPVNVILVLSPALGVAVLAALMTWTVRYGAAAERRAAHGR